jgi:hypothetical protein
MPPPGRFIPGKDPLGPSWTIATKNEKFSVPSFLIITKIFTHEGKKTDIIFCAEKKTD